MKYDLSRLGIDALNAMQQETVQQYRRHRHLVLLSPTGSGKTSTLYAMLKSIDYSIKNVISIEDPIEHVVPAISQMEVNTRAGITFGSLLRNALRQNPDIICLGEIRDEETAEIAVQAAQTGHLIIATLHSNDNIGTIDRLANLNIPLRSIANTLQLVVSQRLVRKLCSCKKHRPPTEEEKAAMQKYDIDCSKVWIPKGCPKCGETGFSGRIALFPASAYETNCVVTSPNSARASCVMPSFFLRSIMRCPTSCKNISFSCISILLFFLFNYINKTT